MSTRAVRVTAVALAVVLVGGSGAAVAQVAASLALSPGSGPPGSSVNASGVFAGHCGVRLFWDGVGGTVLGEAPVGRDGSYATAIAVPSNAAPGDHAVAAAGLVEDRDFVCAMQTGTVASQTFTVTAGGSGLTATLRLSEPQAKPGEGVILDASGSLGEIASFDFDLDGNGSYETSCGGSKVAAVHNERGEQPVGVRVVSADGQEAVDTVVLQIVGTPAAPPPDPGGGTASPFEAGTIAGACVDEAGIDADAIIKAWYCPSTVIVGVIEATFRRWGINAAHPDACFERKEYTLPGIGITATSFVATKPPGGPAWRQNPVLVNGLEFVHPEGDTVWYHNDIGIDETFKRLFSFGKKVAPDNTWQIVVMSPGHRTSFATEPFPWSWGWDVSKPGVMGTFTIGSKLFKPFMVNNEFLGLKVAKKQTPISFTPGGQAKLTVHLAPPFWELGGTVLPTSAVPIVTENNGGHPTAIPTGAQATPGHAAAAPPNVDLEFTGIKLGIFTMDASLSYEQQGGDDVWAGGMELFFPGDAVSVGGTLVIRNGSFESAHFSYEPGAPGIGPIGCCVWVYEIFGDLGPAFVSAGADFGIGPIIPVIEVPPAQVTGEASIFYGDPWMFVLDVSNLKIVGIPVTANADVVISSKGFLAFAFVDEDWGPLELQANVKLNVGSTTWFAGGGASVCVDLEVVEGCGGGYAGIGKKGIAGCAEIPYLPDGGVALDWDFFTGDLLAWSIWWGCSFGDVESEAGGKALARARRASAHGLAAAPVRVAPGTPKVLFAIEGDGAAPKVALTDPDGDAIASAPGEPVNSGPGWTLVELPHDDTTYVTVEDPVAGTWRVEEQAGSPRIVSVGLAEGFPRRIATGTVSGRGATRTLHYDVAELDGLRVTFVERGGAPDSAAPGEQVEQIVKTVDAGSGTIRFTPAEGPVRRRTIEAEIHVDGVPVETETVARFTAPRLTQLPAPHVEARRAGDALRISWTRVPGASGYILEVARSDGPTDVLDVDGVRATVRGMTQLTSAIVTVRPVSPDGYVGKAGEASARPVPVLTMERGLTFGEVLAGGGLGARCVAAAAGTCAVEVLHGDTVVARGDVAVDPGDAESFLVSLTAAGKRLLQRASGRLRLTAVGSVPGSPSARIGVVLTR